MNMITISSNVVEMDAFLARIYPHVFEDIGPNLIIK